MRAHRTFSLLQGRYKEHYFLARCYKGDSTISVDRLESTKKTVGGFFISGRFQEAFKSTIHLESIVSSSSAWKGTITHAAALNNTGLLSGFIGDYSTAFIKLANALEMYDTIVGRKSEMHVRKASTVHGMDKLQQLDHAEDVLTDALRIRNKYLGANTEATLYGTVHLANLLTRKELNIQAEIQLRRVLACARREHPRNEELLATTLASLATAIEEIGQCEEAQRCYMEALEIRSKCLGDIHPDTLSLVSSMAKLYVLQGFSSHASDLREELRYIENFTPDNDTRIIPVKRSHELPSYRHHLDLQAATVAQEDTEALRKEFSESTDRALAAVQEIDAEVNELLGGKKKKKKKHDDTEEEHKKSFSVRLR